MIFRKDHSQRNVSLFLLAITLPVVFISIYYEKLPTNNIANITNPNLGKLASLILVGVGTIYLLYNYFQELNIICKENQISWMKGLSVVTFTLYMIMLLIDNANKYFRFLSDEIVSAIEGQLHLRAILLVLIIIHTLSVAYINSLTNSISRPANLFKTTNTIINLWNPPPSRYPILNFVLNVVKALSSFLLHFYKHFTEFLKSTANIIKLIIEYVFKLVVNYALEILKLIKTFFKIFLLTNLRFFYHYVLPLCLCYLITVAIYFLIQNIYHYINGGGLEYPLWSLITIFVGIIFFVWSITRYNFSYTLNSMVVSNLWLSLTLFISTLIASWMLWLVAQFLDKSLFKAVGTFTAVFSIFLALVVIIIFSIRPKQALR